ncbi:MAG: DUF4351 domain-containing protein, partial [Cyanobacteria bacterium RI_101]|nr:DUF4351 domain-containing protein [Cyanobacteria bacterium RI_101]
LLYERDWDKQRIIDLFAVIDSLMKLAPEPERRLWQSISTLERNLQMPYVTSVERFGIEKGLEQGRQEGRQQGRQEGRQEGLQEGRQEGEALFLQRLLTQKFGALPSEIEARLTSASLSQLEAWGDRLLGADSLEQVFLD